MMVNRIIVEGPDDRHVVMNLLFNHQHNGSHIDSIIDAKEKNGLDHLLETLKEEIGATELASLGIIIDADTDVARQWGRVTRVLDEYGCKEVPALPNPNGTIVETKDGKSVGIWIMPDNQSTGALEDFVGMLIGDGDKLWPKAQDDVENIPADHRRFKETYLSKAQIHTWLAWQEQPGTKMGETFKKRYLDPEHPKAQVFVNWIRELLA